MLLDRSVVLGCTPLLLIFFTPSKRIPTSTRRVVDGMREQPVSNVLGTASYGRIIAEASRTSETKDVRVTLL
jgi:hypothetical protein